jgi:hypothetical protein
VIARPAPRWIAAGLALALSLPVAARADVTGPDRAAAQALFDDGRRLMGDKRYAEACPKFEESQRIDPGLGTLLNLAECQMQTGKTASAWANFLEAAYQAKAAGQSKREMTARARAAALEPKLSRLTIIAGGDAASAEIKRDGKVVSPSLWGTPVPVDPGDHTVTVAAPGKKPWTSTVTVNPDGHQATISVPQLEPVVVAPPPPPALPPDPGRGSRRVAGIIVGIAGLGGLGAGAYFAVQAKNKNNQSLSDCLMKQPTQCSNTGVSLRNDALSDGNVATAAIVLGGAVAVTGLVLLISSAKPSAPARTGSLSITLGTGPSGGGAVGLKGSFQ